MAVMNGRFPPRIAIKYMPGCQFKRSYVDRIKLCDRIRTISSTQPNLAAAILMQAAPLLTSHNLCDRLTLCGTRNSF